MNNNIIIKGARQNNLKNINIEIPRNKIIVITWLSGSGKSSLVFETINSEAQRQLMKTFSTFAQSRLPKFPKADYDLIKNISPVILIDQKRFKGNSRSTVGTITEISSFLRLLFSRGGNKFIGSSSCFSSHSPEGMCNICNGSGKITKLNEKVLIDYDKSLNEGAILFDEFKVNSINWKYLKSIELFNFDKPLKNFSKEELNIFLYSKWEKKEMNIGGGIFTNIKYIGLIPKINKLYLNKDITSLTPKKQEAIKKIITSTPCNYCHGTKLNKEALSVKINNKNIFDISNMQITELYDFVKSINNDIVNLIIEQIKQKCENLINLGIGYLTISRKTTTLSGGEAQRVKLSKHLGCSLTEMIYILDEPSIGLHPRDIHLVNDILKKLRDENNTILVVEHDPDIIKIADHIIDLWPKAGNEGGEIVYEGNFENLKKSKSITGKSLNKNIKLKSTLRKGNKFFSIKNAKTNNLKNISVKIPQNVLTCITGVSGSGKSSLIYNEFHKKYPEAIIIDQTPIGKSNRSNPATYTGVFDLIREEFSMKNKINASLFSFNSQWACPHCHGLGFINIEMAFLDSIKSKCPECNGNRYNKEILQYKYKDYSINDILNLTISDVFNIFDNPKIKNKLNMLINVGLGYLNLGQSLSTLSWGECQRVKLASELNKKGNTYILDEPSTGLHINDIEKIIDIINNLVDKNNSVIVIEHDLNIIKNADWIIDIWPEGWDKGGEIIFTGTPKDLIKNNKSHTAKYLKKYLKISENK